ncbi:MAG: hypothetical protein A4E35_01582 [Methanoregula sp. PtaU1.Bin051]|nr:MAG: hypothetical protein A4E35_01582 [Methanoregula sp. PtaU1.Bin051]
MKNGGRCQVIFLPWTVAGMGMLLASRTIENRYISIGSDNAFQKD